MINKNKTTIYEIEIDIRLDKKVYSDILDIFRIMNLELDNNRIELNEKKYKQFVKKIKTSFKQLNLIFCSKNRIINEYNKNNMKLTNKDIILSSNVQSKYVDWNTFNEFQKNVDKKIDEVKNEVFELKKIVFKVLELLQK